MDDGELVGLIVRDPERGLSELMGRHMGLVVSIVKGRLQTACSREDIEETVSDVFLEFYRGIGNFAPEKGSVKGYLCSIARRRSAEVFKRKLREGDPLSLDDETAIEMPADGSSMDDSLIRDERRQLLFTAIDALGEPDREIVVRKYFLNEPSKSIAKRLDMSVPAVDTRTHRALKKLKKLLGGQEL